MSETSQAPKELAALLGVWTGNWPGGLSMIVTLKDTDSKSMAVHYEWGDMTYPDHTHIQAGGGWHTGKISGDGGISFSLEYFGESRVITLRAEGKYLRTSCLCGSGGNPSVIIGRSNN